MTETLTVRARLQAPIKEVRHALTDTGAMRRWLAEHVEVDLPDRYAFWGRHTPAGDEPRQRPLYADDRTLRLSWRLEGEDTTVEIDLTEETADTTVLRLSQTNMPSWADMMAGTSVRGVLHTFWALAIANLADYVEGRELTPKADFTTAEMRSEVLIGAAPDAVYDSLVDPEKFRRWFGANIEIEPYVGGRWAMGSFEMDESPAKIVELEPGRRMTLAWDGLVATWELADSGGKTRLTLVQSGFDEKAPPYDAWMGWLSGIAELRRYHEIPDWRPMWLEVTLPGTPEGLLALD